MYAIVKDLSDKHFNILPNISNAYKNIAIKARNALLKEFNEFKAKFDERPDHLNHVLDDMEDTRKQKITPLVKTAAATLQEFPAVEEDFNMIFNKATKMLDNLDKQKKICDLNNCNYLLRST